MTAADPTPNPPSTPQAPTRPDDPGPGRTAAGRRASGLTGHRGQGLTGRDRIPDVTGGDRGSVAPRGGRGSELTAGGRGPDVTGGRQGQGLAGERPGLGPTGGGFGWAGDVLAVVLNRVAVTRDGVGERFPLFADPATGRWTTTARGSWTGGFWAGLLWLRARWTGSGEDRSAAAECTRRLAPWADADTATRGLILWYGTALAAGDREAAALLRRGARACLAAADPGLGLLPWGSALGGDRLQARADGVPGTVHLLAAAGPEGVRAAGDHLHRHLDLCLAGAGGSGGAYPAWRFTPGAGWQPCAEPPPGWSRGRAWLLLAVADALLHPAASAWRPDRLRGAAEELLATSGVLDGPPVPPADTAHPGGPYDTSAAAVNAVALLKLAHTDTRRAEQLRRRAAGILRHLADTHLSGRGGARPAGMLLDGCYDARDGTAVRHELIWGDFFLALGLATLTGLTGAAEA
ncbi:sugar ABC transporter permease [Streptomyces sp. NPDC090445]|uniref:sugar ABC transporter permease n=1 Tax=Streptomyces sp. NPDC090445 TaxID=3365963 RepID=UPI0037F7F7D9